MQPLSAVVWQLLACAKPCCCYTWPACRYLYSLCCPAWQLVDCVCVLVERYVSTLINEDYYIIICYCSMWCNKALYFPVCMCIATVPCTRWPTFVRRAGWAPFQTPGSCGQRTWPRASTCAPSASRRRCVRRSAAAARAPACGTARRSGWRSACPAVTGRGWWRRHRTGASAAAAISSTSSSSNCPTVPPGTIPLC